MQQVPSTNFRVMEKMKDLIVALYDAGAVKFGSFTLKSGIRSPIYFDLRIIISHPDLMTMLSRVIEDSLNHKPKIDVICGVPYTALPIATIVSIHKNIPMIIKRKEQKKYGTGNLIEGNYSKGVTKCLIIEDVVTTGSSIVETAQALRDHGILVSEAIVFLNRNYPAADENLRRNGVHLESLIKVDQLLAVLLESSRITAAQKTEVESFLAEGQTIPPTTIPDVPKDDQKEEKSNGNNNELKTGIMGTPSKYLRGHAKRLFNIIELKKSNLCLSADCENWQEVLQVTEAVASKICAVKTHVDAINFTDANEINTFSSKLMELAKKHNFLIIEDRKFADIGSTVEKQLTAKPFSIVDWAEFVTVHSIPGPGMLKVFKEQNKGVILIAEMSSAGNLPALLPEYRNKTLEMCADYVDTVVGFVSQTRVGHSLTTETSGNGDIFLQFTPGVSLHASGDSLGQQYVTVKDAVLKRDADVIIVGRGIIKNGKDKWEQVAEEYRSQGWEALQEKLKLTKV